MGISRRGRRRLTAVAIAGLTIALVAAIAAFGLDVNTARRARQSREAGLAAWRAHDYAGAMTQLCRAHARFDDDIELLMALADCNENVPTADRQNLVVAASLYESVALLEPANRDALHRRLRVVGSLGQRADAEAVLARLIELDPQDTVALAADAGLRRSKMNFDGAERRLAELMRIEPDELAWRTMMLQLASERGDGPHTIVALCEEWAGAYGGDGRMYGLIGQTLLIHRDVPGALGALQMAVELGAGDAGALRSILRTLHGLERFDRATEASAMRERLLERCRSDTANAAWVHTTAIEDAWRAGRVQVALDGLDRACSSAAAPTAALLRWAVVLRVWTDDDGAAASIARYREAIRQGTSPGQPADEHWCDAMEGWLQRSQGGLDEVQARLRRALISNRSDILLQLLFARARSAAGEPEEALRLVEEALARTPDWLELHKTRAELLLELGRPDEAMRTAMRALRFGGRLPTRVLLLQAWVEAGGELHDDAGNRLDTTSFAESLLRASDQHPVVAELLVRLYASSGRSADAARVITDQIARGAAPVDLLNIAETAARMRLDPAIEEMVLVAAEGADPVRRTAAMARLRHRQGRTAEGHGLIEILRSRKPVPPAVAERIDRVHAEFLAATEDPAALEALRALLDGQPRADVAEFVLGTAVAWTDEELVEAAVATMERERGASSTPAVVARGAIVLRFHRDDASEVGAALAALDGVLHRVPNSLPALSIAAALAYRGPSRSVELAVQHLTTAIDSHPRAWGLHAELIRLLQESGDLARAEQYLLRLAGRGLPGPADAQEEVRLWWRQPSFDRGIARLGELAGGLPEVDDQLLIGVMLHRAGRNDEADAHFQRILARPDCGTLATSIIAAFHAEIGQFERGMELLEEADVTEGERAVLIARFCRQAARLDCARAAALAAVQIAGDDPRSWNELALVLLTEQKLLEAADAARSGLALDPASAPLLRSLAMAGLAIGGIERGQALATLESLGEVAWRETELVSGGMRGQVIGPAQLAESRELVDRHPGYLPAWRLAFELHAGAGEHEEARLIGEQARRAFPTAPEPAGWVAHELVALGQTHAALLAARIWCDRVACSAALEPDVMIAGLLLALERCDDAHAQIARHGETIWDARGDERHTMRVWMHAGLGSESGTAAALARIEGLLTEAPGIWFDELIRIVALIAPKFARPVLRELGRVAPERSVDIALAWTRLPADERLAEDLEEARALATAALAHDPSSVPAGLALAWIAVCADDLAEAERLYRDVVERAPEDATALNDLANTILASGGDGTEALGLVERALAVETTRSLQDTRAQILLLLDRLEAAEAEARRAVAGPSPAPAHRLTLARVLVAAGKDVEAGSTLAALETELGLGLRFGGTLEDRIDRVARLFDY